MTIYTPYFYVIQDVQTKMYYAGSKYAKDANPSMFMVEGGYTTSSKTVNRIIRERGLQSFVIRRVTTFASGLEAYSYEKRFLTKINAAANKNFYNYHNNNLPSFGSIEFSNIMTDIYGVENAMHFQPIVDKRCENFISRYGVKTPFECASIRQKSTETVKAKYGVDNVFQSNEVKDKIRETVMVEYGVEYISQSPTVKEKVKVTNVQRLGVEYPMQSVEILAKRVENTLEKYGVPYTTQLDSVKEKARKKTIELNNRPTVLQIRQYKKIYGFPLSGGWYRKSDDYLNNVLSEIRTRYGEL